MLLTSREDVDTFHMLSDLFRGRVLNRLGLAVVVKRSFHPIRETTDISQR